MEPISTLSLVQWGSMEDVTTELLKKFSAGEKSRGNKEGKCFYSKLTEKEIIKICLRSEDIKRKKILYRWNCVVEDKVQKILLKLIFASMSSVG